jgi:glycerol-3-phosphate dehydrogenase
METGDMLKELFHTKSLEISLKIGEIKNIELYGALKNIFSLIMGYYEGKGYEGSAISYFFCKYFDEFTRLVEFCGGNNFIHFNTFSL